MPIISCSPPGFPAIESTRHSSESNSSILTQNVQPKLDAQTSSSSHAHAHFRPYPTRPSLPDPIIARIISHYFHLREVERESRQREAVRRWEKMMRCARLGRGGTLELRDEREWSEIYRVLPLLLASRYTSSLTLPLIYADITIIGMHQLHQFITRPVASSYAYIQVIRFEQSFWGQRTEGYFLGEERLNDEIKVLGDRLAAEAGKGAGDRGHETRSACPTGSKVVVGKTSLAVFDLVAVLQIPEIVFTEDAIVPVSPLWIAYNSFMGERARLELPELRLTIQRVEADLREVELGDEASEGVIGEPSVDAATYEEPIAIHYHSNAFGDTGSESSHSSHSKSRSYSTSSSLSDISLTQPLMALIAQLKHNESMSIRLEPVKQLHSRTYSEGEDLLRGIEVTKVVRGDHMHESEQEQNLNFGCVHHLLYGT